MGGGTARIPQGDRSGWPQMGLETPGTLGGCARNLFLGGEPTGAGADWGTVPRAGPLFPEFPIASHVPWAFFLGGTAPARHWPLCQGPGTSLQAGTRVYETGNKSGFGWGDGPHSWALNSSRPPGVRGRIAEWLFPSPPIRRPGPFPGKEAAFGPIIGPGFALRNPGNPPPGVSGAIAPLRPLGPVFQPQTPRRPPGREPPFFSPPGVHRWDGAPQSTLGIGPRSLLFWFGGRQRGPAWGQLRRDRELSAKRGLPPDPPRPGVFLGCAFAVASGLFRPTGKTPAG